MKPAKSRPPSPPRPDLGTLGLCIVIVAVGLVYDALSFGSWDRFWAAIDHCPQPFCDFATYYLPMSRGLFEGTGPILHYLYPPLLAILILPLAPLPGATALLAWGIFKAALIPALIALPFALARRTGLRQTALAVGVAAASFPILHDFKWGQVSVPITVSVLAGIALWQRGRRVPGAFFLALATALKLYPVWFALPLLLRRDARALLWYGAFCVLLLGVIPGLVLGADGTIRFYQGLAAQLRGVMEMALDPNSQSLDGVFLRLGAGPQAPSPLVAWITPVRLAVLAVSGFAVFRAGRAENAGLVTMTLFATLPFVTPTSWPHYFVFLPGAFVVLVWEAPDQGAARAGVVALAFAGAFLASLPCWQLFGGWLRYSAWGVLFWANALTLLGLWIAIGFSRPASGGGSRPRKGSAAARPAG